MIVWSSFLIAFSALLPLVNPLSSALVFLGLVGEAPPSVYRALARKIAINTVCFLAVFELLGSAILNFFGISLPIVQVAGGIVIAAIGWSVLNAKDSEASANDKREEAQLSSLRRFDSLQDKAFYPFTFPVTAGPGTLVVLLTLSARFSDGTRSSVVFGHLGLFIAIFVLSVAVYYCYANAPIITKAIAPSTAHGILRVVAFILLCIGVQILWNGLSSLLLTVIHHR
ncbi:MarC family protein [Terriglobus sp. TAA 43]|uniref:MarC family protein n=1 Tax=Terriglobus sp. TAA 43 TaxID=278961 RepID=UPI000647D497|nr:MarC family protein [Terriglobus sp. TAA 43]